MVATSRTTPSAAPTNSVMSGVLRFMWGPTHLEARRVQYCAEVSQLSLTPDATWRATPRRRFPGQADGEASGRCGRSRSGSWIPPPGTWRRPDHQSKDPGSRYTGYSTRVQQMLSWSERAGPGRGHASQGHVRSAAAGALVTGAPDGRAAEPPRC